MLHGKLPKQFFLQITTMSSQETRRDFRSVWDSFGKRAWHACKNHQYEIKEMSLSNITNFERWKKHCPRAILKLNRGKTIACNFLSHKTVLKTAEISDNISSQMWYICLKIRIQIVFNLLLERKTSSMKNQGRNWYSTIFKKVFLVTHTVFHERRPRQSRHACFSVHRHCTRVAHWSCSSRDQRPWQPTTPRHPPYR